MNTKHCTCKGCGMGFFAPRKRAYCTMLCRPGFHDPSRHQCCGLCGIDFQHPRKKKYCTSQCAKTAAKQSNRRGLKRLFVRKRCDGQVCRQCGVRFCSLSKKRLLLCSSDCKAAVYRAMKAKYEAVRRARMQPATAEAVDPITIFERDDWRCYICGTDTPKALRGTTHPQAPELDHMVSLANGGRHVMRNLACSCRRCNGLKGALNWDEFLMTG